MCEIPKYLKYMITIGTKWGITQNGVVWIKIKGGTNFAMHSDFRYDSEILL